MLKTMISLQLCPHPFTRQTNRLFRVNGAYQYLRIQVQTINSYLYTETVHLQFTNSYELTPAREQVLFEFLFFLDSFCFWRRVQRSPRELGVPQGAFSILLTPKQTTIDTPLTVHAVVSVYSDNKFIADRLSLLEKKPTLCDATNGFPAKCRLFSQSTNRPETKKKSYIES